MYKNIRILAVTFSFILGLLSLGSCADEVTITTYYPSPYGAYNQLTTYSNTYLAASGGFVGIGTTAPSAQLEIRSTTPTFTIGNTVTNNVNSGTIELLEDVDYDFGATYGYGFSLTVDGAANKFLIKSGTGTTVTSRFSIDRETGNVGIGIISPTAKLHINGDLQVGTKAGIGGAPRAADTLAVYGRVSTNFTGAGSRQMFAFDLAEDIAAAGDVEPGDVVVVDSDINQFVRKANKPYDVMVAGIISKSPAFHIAMPDGKTPLALAGRVLCKVTTQGGGPIKRGDLLVTSTKPGHAMKGNPKKITAGTVLGKALEPLDKGDGKIVVLVTLQ